MLQLLILMTTANFPDVMMPVYKCSRWNAAFFVVFLMTGTYFLLSVVLAVAYSVFTAQAKTKVVKMTERRLAATDAAFIILTQVRRSRIDFENRGDSASADDGGDDDVEGRVGRSYSANTLMTLCSQQRGAASLGRSADVDPDENRSPSGTMQSPMQDLARGMSSESIPALGVTLDDWMQLMHAVRPDLDETASRILFHMLDWNRDGELNAYEFYRVPAFVLLDIRPAIARLT